MTDSKKQRVILYPTITGKFYVYHCLKQGPKPLPPELKKRRVNIALSPHWHEKGKQMAAEKGLSFSRYMELLIYADSLHNESV
jgi:hypothetical protein